MIQGFRTADGYIGIQWVRRCRIPVRMTAKGRTCSFRGEGGKVGRSARMRHSRPQVNHCLCDAAIDKGDGWFVALVSLKIAAGREANRFFLLMRVHACFGREAVPHDRRGSSRARAKVMAGRSKKLARQIAPEAAGPQQIQNGVHRRPHVGLARSFTRRRLGEQRLQPRPNSASVRSLG
jgi:hypothetical protein